MYAEDPFDLSGWHIHKLTSALDSGLEPDEIDPELTMFPERYNDCTTYTDDNAEQADQHLA